MHSEDVGSTPGLSHFHCRVLTGLLPSVERPLTMRREPALAAFNASLNLADLDLDPGYLDPGFGHSDGGAMGGEPQVKIKLYVHIYMYMYSFIYIYISI